MKDFAKSILVAAIAAAADFLVDMLKDNKELNEMWSKGNAPWKVW